ncbi:MAG: hypothetical protein VYE40_02690 [Myxococcota bacterium]|nr:hypothetical protein [Myxococcota bacterium]MEC9439990.1 hypothetical protein [Myxococcota bacterium]
MARWLKIEDRFEWSDVEDDASAPRVSVLTPDDDASGWAARLRGLDPDYDFRRVFLAEEVEASSHPGMVLKHYTLGRDGFYQVHTPLLEVVREFVFVRKLGEQLEVLEKDVVCQMLRGESRYTMLDVEAACGSERWRDAFVAAMHLEDAQQRAHAMQEIRSARLARAPSGWNPLEGTERQVRWAGVIRESSARMMTELMDLFFQELEGPGDLSRLDQANLERFTRLTRANTRLRAECDAQYWITQRHELELGGERLLEALIEGESQRHEDVPPIRLEELGDRDSE